MMQPQASCIAMTEEAPLLAFVAEAAAEGTRTVPVFAVPVLDFSQCGRSGHAV